MPPPAQSNQDEPQGNGSSHDELPGSLNRKKDLELEGRHHHPIIRHGILSLLVIIVLAALAGAFGQRSEHSTAASSEATLTLEAPHQLRSGLIFAARLDLEAGISGIAAPRIEFSRGWLDHITNNSLRPEPSSQTSSDGRLRMVFPSLDPEESMTLWTRWQVNPTAAGRFDGHVWVYDGNRLLTGVDRMVTIFP